MGQEKRFQRAEASEWGWVMPTWSHLLFAIMLAVEACWLSTDDAPVSGVAIVAFASGVNFGAFISRRILDDLITAIQEYLAATESRK